MKRYNMDSHEMRDLLKSTLIDSGYRIDIADHVIGHKPKDSCEKQSVLYPETMRKEFAKASNRLNLFSKFSSVVSGNDDADELRVELREKIAEIAEMKNKSDMMEAESIRRERESAEYNRRLAELTDAVKKLEGGAVSARRRDGVEFCCIGCSTVHSQKQCPACGSKLKRIYDPA